MIKEKNLMKKRPQHFLSVTKYFQNKQRKFQPHLLTCHFISYVTVPSIDSHMLCTLGYEFGYEILVQHELKMYNK